MKRWYLPTTVLLALAVWVIPESGSAPSATRERAESLQALTQLSAPPVQLDTAEKRLTAACMKGHGFQYPVVEIRGPRQTVRSSPRSVRYAIVAGFGHPLAGWRVRRDGYGHQLDEPLSVKDEQPQLSERQLDRYARLLDDAQGPQIRLRLGGWGIVGASARGCVSDARRGLYGSVRNFLRVEYLWQGILSFRDAALQEPSVREAVADYRACISKEGYEVDNPAQALALARKTFQDGMPRKVTMAERAMAMSDARCQARSDIYETLSDGIETTSAVWRAHHQDELGEVAALMRLASRRAVSVLAGRGLSP